jgi:hypothetical protein
MLALPIKPRYAKPAETSRLSARRSQPSAQRVGSPVAEDSARCQVSVDFVIAETAKLGDHRSSGCGSAKSARKDGPRMLSNAVIADVAKLVRSSRSRPPAFAAATTSDLSPCPSRHLMPLGYVAACPVDGFRPPLTASLLQVVALATCARALVGRMGHERSATKRTTL